MEAQEQIIETVATRQGTSLGNCEEDQLAAVIKLFGFDEEGNYQRISLVEFSTKIWMFYSRRSIA